MLLLFSSAIDQVASYNDFSSDSLLTLVTFASDDNLKPVSIQILDDNVPEIIEYFTLQIENPQGGKAIINDDKVYGCGHCGCGHCGCGHCGVCVCY